MIVANVTSNVADFFGHASVCQGAYLGGILSQLQVELGSRFADYDFLLFEIEHGDPHYLRTHDFSARKTVVFYLGNEVGTIPHELMRTPVHAVFMHYLPEGATGYANLFGLPLGYVSSTPQYPVLPVAERPTNVFFSGATHYTRLPLLQHFTGWDAVPFRLWNAMYHRFFKERVAYRYDDQYPNSLIRFNRQGFKSGFAPEEFGRLLYECKIALCPQGVINPETYRHFEALRAGCVVVSAPLPTQYYYTGSPIVTLPDWRGLDAVIANLLADADRLAQRQQAGLAWWNEICSETAVARRMAMHLRELAGHDARASGDRRVIAS